MPVNQIITNNTSCLVENSVEDALWHIFRTIMRKDWERMLRRCRSRYAYGDCSNCEDGHFNVDQVDVRRCICFSLIRIQLPLGYFFSANKLALWTVLRLTFRAGHLSQSLMTSKCICHLTDLPLPHFCSSLPLSSMHTTPHAPRSVLLKSYSRHLMTRSNSML